MTERPRKRLKGDRIGIEELPWFYEQALQETNPRASGEVRAWFEKIRRERLARPR